MSDVKQQRLVKRVCDLCGKPCKPSELHVGGYVSYAHERCTEIGNRAIDLWVAMLFVHPMGMHSLSDALGRYRKEWLRDLRKRNKESLEEFKRRNKNV